MQGTWRQAMELDGSDHHEAVKTRVWHGLKQTGREAVLRGVPEGP